MSKSRHRAALRFSGPARLGEQPSAKRRGGKGVLPSDEALKAGDTVLLIGSEAAVVAAESVLLTGK